MTQSTRKGQRRRVVITGLSVLSPLAPSLSETWEKALNGQSGVKKSPELESAHLDVYISGDVPNLVISDHFNKKELKKLGRFIQLILICTKAALKDSGLEMNNNEALAARAGVITGSAMGGMEEIIAQQAVLDNHGPHRISPLFIPSILTNMAPAHISLLLGTRGPNFSVNSACAAGAHAIGEAARYIWEGHCDLMISGGSESCTNPLSVSSFCNMRALSSRNGDPERASRPWDKDRDGFVISEGAGICILEDYEHAVRRGAPIYGELTGYGFSSDAYHITSPPKDGQGAFIAMTQALKHAQLNPEDIDYINAHGTSTPIGDFVETVAIKNAFGDHAKKLWISSTKSMTGHTLGAAGAIEGILSVMSIKHNAVHPTINLDQPDFNCDLDYVPHEAREKEIKHALCNSFGFGGTNAALIFSQV